jgi:crotonobetainyl-CoA:carnitine CoA-transferase CaiB-like acyl-CoA transferase
MKGKLPLEGIRILDASRVLAGPFCTMLLSDLGAEVTKVEDPEKGDETRNYQPMIGDESSYFLSINRNKDVVFLNLKDEADRKTLYSLAKKSDVFIHNFLPGVEEKLGVGYDAISSKNGRIVYVTISGYGRTGRRSNLPGYDILMQGESGLMSVTGLDEENLARIGNSTVDIYAGYLCATAILAYLYSRSLRKQKSVKLDIPLIGSVLYSMPFLFGYFAATGKDPKPLGTAHPGIVPYQPFKTKDGTIMIAVANNNHWQKFCNTIGRVDLLEDKRFSTNELRVRNREQLIPILKNVIVQKSTGQWLKLFRKTSVPAAPINRVSDVMKDGELARFIDKKSVRGKKMLFPKLPVTVNEEMIYSYRRDPPEFRKLDRS